MKYTDEFIEETLRENINLRLQYFEEKDKRQKSEERYINYRREISKEAQNKNKEQVLRERNILQDRINMATKLLEELSKLYEDNYTISDKAKDITDILKGVDKK